MCLILFALDAHPDDALLLASNRDEFFHRPASAASWWPDAPGILGRRDLQAGGTWLGLRRDGRIAALTNYREAPAQRKADAPTRGMLVSDCLQSPHAPEQHLQSLADGLQTNNPHNGFSLLAGSAQGLWVMSNRSKLLQPQAVPRGVHGLSNHLLNTPWHKVERGRAGLHALVAAGPVALNDLLDLLDDTDPAPAAAMPQESDTQHDAALTQRLSAMRLLGPHYGTRCSTALRISRNGKAELLERSWHADGSMAGEVHHCWQLSS